MRQWITIQTLQASECRHCAMSTARRKRNRTGDDTPYRHWNNQIQAAITYEATSSPDQLASEVEGSKDQDEQAAETTA